MNDNKLSNDLIELWTRNLRYLVLLSGLLSLFLLYKPTQFNYNFWLLIICYVSGIMILWIDHPKYANIKYVLDFILCAVAGVFVFPPFLEELNRSDDFNRLFVMWLALLVVSLVTRKAAKLIIIFYNQFIRTHLQNALNSSPALKSVASTIGMQWALVTLNISLWITGPTIGTLHYYSENDFWPEPIHGWITNDLVPLVNHIAGPFPYPHVNDPFGYVKTIFNPYVDYAGLILIIIIGYYFTKYLQSFINRHTNWLNLSNILDIVLMFSLALFLVNNYENAGYYLTAIISLSVLIFSLTVKSYAWSIGSWPVDVADLIISMKPLKDTVSPGERIDYLIEVKNQGPSKARSVRVEDVVFGGKIVDIKSDDMDFFFKDYKATCSMKELDTDKSASIMLSVNVGLLPEKFNEKIYSRLLNCFEIPNNYSINNMLNNKAKVSSATYDPTSSNNRCESSPVKIKEKSDLAIQIDLSQSKAHPEDKITCDLSVTNHGPSNARGIVVKFPMTNELEYVPPHVPDTEKYDYDKRIWSFDKLAKDAIRSIKISARIGPVPECQLDVSAEVSSDVDDPDPSNNAAKKPFSVLPLSHINIAPIGHPDSIYPGDPIKYSIAVTNDGPSPAKEIKIKTDLHEGTTPKPPFPENWDAIAKIWTIRDLVAEKDKNKRTLELEVGTDGLEPCIDAELRLSVEPNPDLRFDKIPPAKTEVKRIAHLSVNINPEESKAYPGEDISYNIHLKNDGPCKAKKIKIDIKIPDGIEQIGHNFAGQDSGEYISGLWDLGELLPSGERTLTIKARAKMIKEQTLTVKATVTSDTDDLKKPNAPAEAKTHILPLSRLDISPSGSPQKIFPGEPIKYSIAVTNNGPSTAKEIKIKTVLHEGTTPKEPFPENWDTSTKIWTIKDLVAEKNQNKRTLELEVGTDGLEPCIDAELKLSVEPNPDLRFDKIPPAKTEVKRIAHLSVNIKPKESKAYPGEEISYNIYLKNDGPCKAGEIKVDIKIPDGIEQIDHSFAGQDSGKYIREQGQWDLGELLPSGERMLTIKAKAKMIEEQTLAVVAAVSSDADDPKKPNAPAEAKTHILPLAILDDPIVFCPEVILPGESIDYSITIRNKGPSKAKDVKIKIRISPGTKCISLDSNMGKYNSNEDIWHINELDTKEPCIIKIKVDASALSPGSIAEFAFEISSATRFPCLPKGALYTRTLVKKVNLDVNFVASPCLVLPGELIVYKVSVRNPYQIKARDVRAYISISEETTHEYSSTTKGSYDHSNGLWNIGDIAEGDLAELTLVVKVKPIPGGSIERSVEIYSSLTDTSTFQVSTNVIASATLRALLRGSITQSKNKQSIYSITLNNLGPSNVRDVMVKLAIPEGTNIISPDCKCDYFIPPKENGEGIWLLHKIDADKTEELSLTTENNDLQIVMKDIRALITDPLKKQDYPSSVPLARSSTLSKYSRGEDHIASCSEVILSERSS